MIYGFKITTIGLLIDLIWAEKSNMANYIIFLVMHLQSLKSDLVGRVTVASWLTCWMTSSEASSKSFHDITFTFGQILFGKL